MREGGSEELYLRLSSGLHGLYCLVSQAKWGLYTWYWSDYKVAFDFSSASGVANAVDVFIW